MKWTQDQRRAIEARGTNLLLSAAAGSGKTTVLVERVLSLIGDGMDVDRMLIVTFSRAAAADMKDKLTRSLMERAKKNAEMARQVEKVERACVCTIHSYCMDVLKAHFVAAGVDPSFRVLDDAEDAQLRGRALNETLEEAFTAADEGLNDLMYGRDVGEIGQMIYSLYAFSQERPDPENWLDMISAHNPNSIELWKNTLAHFAQCQLEEAASVTQYAMEQAVKGPAAYAETLKEDLTLLTGLMRQDSYETLYDGLAHYTAPKLRPFRAPKEDSPDAQYLKELAQQVRKLREEQKRNIEKARAMLPEPDAALEDTQRIVPAVQALVSLTRQFADHLWELKQERSALNFSDMEHAALRALSDDRVAASQRARFQCVFVDEYQDVSDLQEAIIKRIAGSDNLFMVGDVKQSIYRFRQAQPGLFIDKYKRYGSGDGGTLIALSQNYRSRPSILSFVNRIFEKAMSGPNAEIEYDSAARLNPGASFPDADPRTQVLLIRGDANAPDAELTTAQHEGALAADKIRELLSGGRLFDAGINGYRAIRPRDIAVLSRTRAGLTACEQMLKEEAIPCYLDASEGYFDALEVRVMLCLMQAVENRRRDIPLLSVLRSPVVGLTSTQLAQIRGNMPEGPFYEAFRAYAQKSGKLAGKLLDFSGQLDRWRMLSRALPLSEWVNTVMMESGYYAYVGGMPGGIARQGNLDLLCAYASQVEDTQSGGLTAFLDYVGEIHRTGSDMGTAHTLGAGDDVVQLMTVHKSKGLEFPVVIGVNLGRNLAGGNRAGELKCHRTLGAGITFHDAQLGTRRDTLARRAIACVQQTEDMEEEKRILYVMLTRAKDRLILIGSEKNPGEAMTRWDIMRHHPLRPKSFLDMVMPVLSEQEEVVWCGQRDNAESPGDLTDAQDIDGQTVEEMLRAMSWKYPYEGEELTPLKLTASGLSREVVGPAIIPEAARRPSFLSRRSMTPTERGTLIHAALSLLDLRALRECGDMAQELRRQLDTLYARNLVPQQVDDGPILAFLQRDAGRRLLRAETVNREWPFNLRMTARETTGADSDAMVVVQGVIDCCFMEDGQWVLMDYKTDRVDQDVMLKKYSSQLLLYKKALGRITGIPVRETWICLLSAGREIPVSGQEE